MGSDSQKADHPFELRRGPGIGRGYYIRCADCGRPRSAHPEPEPAPDSAEPPEHDPPDDWMRPKPAPSPEREALRPLWKCVKCGVEQQTEAEVLCWKCGGEMTYYGLVACRTVTHSPEREALLAAREALGRLKHRLPAIDWNGAGCCPLDEIGPESCSLDAALAAIDALIRKGGE